MKQMTWLESSTLENDGEVANLLRTCCGLVSDTANKSATSPQPLVVMEFGKRLDLVMHLLFVLQTCCGLVTGKLV